MNYIDLQEHNILDAHSIFMGKVPSTRTVPDRVLMLVNSMKDRCVDITRRLDCTTKWAKRIGIMTFSIKRITKYVH